MGRLLIVNGEVIDRQWEEEGERKEEKEGERGWKGRGRGKRLEEKEERGWKGRGWEKERE